jgi:hypothetical protein
MLQRRVGGTQREVRLQREGEIAAAIGEGRPAPGAAGSQRRIRIRARPAADGFEGQGKIVVEIEAAARGGADRQARRRGPVDGREADRYAAQRDGARRVRSRLVIDRLGALEIDEEADRT